MFYLQFYRCLNHSQIFIKEAQNARETLIWVLGNPRCTRVEWRVPQCGLLFLQKSEVYKDALYLIRRSFRRFDLNNPDEPGVSGK
jgi:hypothetical protein